MSAAPRWATVIFDLDGTLTDSAPGITGGVAHALQTLGYPVPGPAALRRHIGPPLEWGFRTFCGMDAATAVTARDAFRDYYATQGWANNAVYPGIPDLLAQLQAAGIQEAVATSKVENMARRILGHFGLDVWFAAICGAGLDEGSADKTGLIRRAIHELGDPPLSQVVMVGDRHHDIDAARSLGMDSIAVQWGYGTASEWEGATAVVPTVSALQALLLGR